MFVRNPAVFLLMVIFGAVLATQSAFAGKPRDPAEFFFEQTLGDLTEDLNDAKSKGKKGVLLFFEQEECPFCHRMKNTVLNQPEVQDFYRKNFLIFSIDIETQSEIIDFDGSSTTMKKLFAKVARNRGATPVFAFFDLEGNLVVRYTGASSGVEEFMWLGEYASKGIYKEMPFSRYKRKMRKQNSGT